MEDFETDAVRDIMSKIYLSMQDSDEESPFHADISELSKAHETSIESIRIETVQKQAKKVKPDDFAKTTLVRMQNRAKKSQDVLQKVKDQVEKQKSVEVKKIPAINQKSKKMVGTAAPIQERVGDVLLEKERKLEELKLKINSERDQKLKKELTFKPQIIAKSSKPRSADEFFKYNED